jgi:hypothetical protein
MMAKCLLHAKEPGRSRTGQQRVRPSGSRLCSEDGPRCRGGLQRHWLHSRVGAEARAHLLNSQSPGAAMAALLSCRLVYACTRRRWTPRQQAAVVVHAREWRAQNHGHSRCHGTQGQKWPIPAASGKQRAWRCRTVVQKGPGDQRVTARRGAACHAQQGSVKIAPACWCETEASQCKAPTQAVACAQASWPRSSPPTNPRPPDWLLAEAVCSQCEDPPPHPDQSHETRAGGRAYQGKRWGVRGAGPQAAPCPLAVSSSSPASCLDTVRAARHRRPPSLLLDSSKTAKCGVSSPKLNLDPLTTVGGRARVENRWCEWPVAPERGCWPFVGSSAAAARKAVEAGPRLAEAAS